MYKLYFLGFLLIMSCNNGPKVIKTQANPESDVATQSTGIFSNDGSSNEFTERSSEPSGAFTDGLHQVKVIETLPTSKYIYLRVSEGDEEYWVATRKQDVSIGSVYFFRDGLLKTNFESKEYDRIFDKLYLVSNLVPAGHAQGGSSETASSPGATIESPTEAAGKTVTWPASKDVQAASTRIKDLVTNKDKYEGKEVQLTGECVKVNPNIMGRNWIHLRDGSMDEYDLVVTSQVAVPEGHVVTMKGTVVLDQDFGAGYSYAILVENAELVR